MRPIFTDGRGLQLDGTVGAKLRGQQPLQSRPYVSLLTQTPSVQEALRQVALDGEGWPRPIIKGAIVNGRGAICGKHDSRAWPGLWPACTH
jgi:hypothetical protein